MGRGPGASERAAEMHVTVIGAGVAGLACALELAERGAQVEVLDRAERRGTTCCSWFAGGMLAPWCELESSEPLIATLGTESIPWWQERFSATVARGTLVVAHGRDAGELTRFSRRTERYEWLDGDGIARLEPDLTGRFGRALYFKDEAHLDPRAALQGLEQRLQGLGVSVQHGVGGDERAARKGCSVDCRGLAAREVLTDLRGVKGEMLLLKLPELMLSRPVRILHPRMPLYIVPRGAGLFMVGATMLESDQPTRVSARSMLELLSAAYALHPAFGEAEIIEMGTGVRPALPDNLPCIRRRGDSLYVNGLYRHGFLLAPALARRVAEVVLHGRFYPEVMGDENSRERRLA
ncbi:MAG TPA: glycine oxidase ThiO [Steroidobacteraceae bacterium]|nr:glycine oxidase ThiO [Steroidobacteraceae bacterium]